MLEAYVYCSHKYSALHCLWCSGLYYVYRRIIMLNTSTELLNIMGLYNMLHFIFMFSRIACGMTTTAESSVFYRTKQFKNKCLSFLFTAFLPLARCLRPSFLLYHSLSSSPEDLIYNVDTFGVPQCCRRC